MSKKIDPVAGHISSSGLPKEEHYKWRQDTGRGVYRELSPHDIGVDHAYQRAATERHVMKIASQWSWIACGAICVSKRPDGSFWAIDGQHRVLAARKRGDCQTIPCLVFEVERKTAEAGHFVEINTVRKGMCRIARHNANATSGEPNAIRVNAMLAKYGYSVSECGNKPLHVSCVVCLTSCMVRDSNLCERVFELCVRIVNREPISEKLFGGLFELETKLRKREDPHSIFDKLNVDRLCELGVSGLQAAIDDACRYYKKGGYTIYAKGLIGPLNHRRKVNRIAGFDSES